MFPFDPPENILSSGESKGIIRKNMVNILYTPYNFQAFLFHIYLFFFI